MTPLRLVFMGTPAFALPALEALHAAGHQIAAVYTQPPRPAGRGHRVRPSPVQGLAERLGLPVRSPTDLRGDEERAALAALAPEAVVVVAYGLILPPAILAVPRLGCLNVHPSLLPRWRGPAPIPRTIEAGDAETGVTILRLDEGVDSGAIVLVTRIAVPPRATAGTLHDRLAAIGARAIVEALAGLAEGRLRPRPQPTSGITYAAKFAPEERRLDWRRPAAVLDRKVRALAPRPGAVFRWRDEAVRVLAAEPADGAGAPGTVLDAAFTVACGEGALRLVTVQRPGRAAVAGEAFLRGARLFPGERLPCRATG